MVKIRDGGRVREKSKARELEYVCDFREMRWRERVTKLMGASWEKTVAKLIGGGSQW